MLEESFAILTSLQEDPNIQRLEMEMQKLQVQYDNVHSTTQTVVMTQCLAKLQ